MSEDEPKDWEPVPDEIPPDKLQKKWDGEEYAAQPAVVCSSCKINLPPDSFRCLHCGARVFKDSGLLGKIISWIQFWR